MWPAEHRLLVRGPSGHNGSGRLGRDDERTDSGEALGDNRVITSMAAAAAGFSFFLDVGDFTTGSHLAVPADNASAGECGETEKPNKTHAPSDSCREQYVCRRMWIRVTMRAQAALDGAA